MFFPGQYYLRQLLLLDGRLLTPKNGKNHLYSFCGFSGGISVFPTYSGIEPRILAMETITVSMWFLPSAFCNLGYRLLTEASKLPKIFSQRYLFPIIGITIGMYQIVLSCTVNISWYIDTIYDQAAKLLFNIREEQPSSSTLTMMERLFFMSENMMSKNA